VFRGIATDVSYRVVLRDQRDRLGEGPLWSSRDNALYWVDILAPALHRLSLMDGAVASWRMPEPIGWVIERANDPGFIAGFQSGFAELTLDPFEIQPIADPEPHLPRNRLNDAKADLAGRIWAGSMHVNAVIPSGSLYRFDPDHSVRTMDSGYVVANGPAFSPAHDYIYHTDSGRGVVYRFVLNADGTLGERTAFLRFEVDWGKPDGMTVDADGALWIAHWGAARVSRFTPDGEVDRVIHLPTSQITSCAFAGENLDRMFVTSAAIDNEQDPLAGALFEIDPGIRGLAPGQFAG
jgi:sugar lactone lactonase YvrE